MATGSRLKLQSPRIKHQIPVLSNTKCELCEENEIQWKCFNCTKYQQMCNTCAKVHLRSEHTQHHRVTSMRDSERPFDQHENKCAMHPVEDVQIYCKPCDTPICHDCLTSGSHQNHKLVKFDDIIESKHRELVKMAGENAELIALFEKNLNLTRKNREDYLKDVKQRTEVIQSRNGQLKAKLDVLTKNAMTALQEREKHDMGTLTRKEEELETNVAEFKKLANECKDKLSGRNISMLQFAAHLRQWLDAYKSCDLLEPIKCLDLVYKDIGDRELMEILGYLTIPSHSIPKAPNKRDKVDVTPTIDVKLVKGFSLKNKNILAPVSGGQVWMASTKYKDISLVTVNGDVVRTVNTIFDVGDLAVTKSGDVLATVSGGNEVLKLTSDNTFIDLYTSSHYTSGITVTDNDTIVVCLNGYGKGKGKLVELSSSGQLINQEDQSPLFKNPIRVTSNMNDDLIILQSNNAVVVVDKTHNKRFTYTGQVEGLKEPFDPQYAVTDHYGHILISDCKNHVIHILDKNGNLIKYIRTDEHGVDKPDGICIDTCGRLWVSSNHSGKVLIFKYI